MMKYGMGMKGPMGYGKGMGMSSGRRQLPEVLTCIAKDVQDPTSQIRLTLSGARSSVGGRGFSPNFGGYGDYDDWDDDDWWDDDDDDNWMYGGDEGYGGLGGGEYRLDG